jgi:hypothetical protein
VRKEAEQGGEGMEACGRPAQQGSEQEPRLKAEDRERLLFCTGLTQWWTCALGEEKEI